MAIQQTSNGRYRATIFHQGKRVSVAQALGLGRTTFKNKTEARNAYRDAEKLLRALPSQSGPTVKEFWQRWTAHPLYQRPKESTNRHNQERTRAFVAKYGDLELSQVSDHIVGEWVLEYPGTVPALRAMFNDARSGKAGRLIQVNPFAELGIRRSKGNAGTDPPSEEIVRALIAAARKVSSPSFAAWLEVACFTGMRPGELDALRWQAVDLEAGMVHVREQVSAATGKLTLPKNGLTRRVPLVAESRSALLGLPEQSEFVFTNFSGNHWTASARAYHFKAVKAAVGYTGSLYLCTRHWAGWYMTNVLLLPAEDVAIILGHQDGGELVRRNYGHRSVDMALERVRAAYASRANVRQLRAVKDEAS